MAYQVVVDKPQQIRALASSASISVADAQLTNSQVLVTHASYAAAVSSRIVGAFAAYSEPVVQIYYQNLSAIDIALDPYSLNKYFRLEQVGMSDAQALLVTKGLNELVGAADQVALQFSKSQADNFGMGDNAVVLLEILREFADSASVIDVQTLSLGLSKSETLGTADTASMFISKTESDVANIGEQAAVGVSKPFADSTSLSDQLSRAAVFQRVFSDAFVLDDFTDVDAITKDSTQLKITLLVSLTPKPLVLRRRYKTPRRCRSWQHYLLNVGLQTVFLWQTYFRRSLCLAVRSRNLHFFPTAASLRLVRSYLTQRRCRKRSIKMLLTTELSLIR